MNNFVAPTGYVDLDNDCEYSIDLKSTRSREEVNPKEDLAFYFKTYIVPKYGLNNINVSNVASFMKDLEMNWTKLDTRMKDQVMNIMVDDILTSGNYDFKNSLMTKLGISAQPPIVTATPQPLPISGKSSFGESSDNNNMMMLVVAFVAVVLLFVFLDRAFKNGKPKAYSKIS